jgi:hypothetical protein
MKYAILIDAGFLEQRLGSQADPLSVKGVGRAEMLEHSDLVLDLSLQATPASPTTTVNSEVASASAHA